jgi:hypothetical protein
MFRGRGVPPERRFVQAALSAIAFHQHALRQSRPQSGQGSIVLHNTEVETAQSQARRAIVLVARSAFAAAPYRQMQQLCDLAAALPGVDHTSFGFTEQGTPSLREALAALRQQDFSDILILPLMLPIEPSFNAWLTKSLRRWQAEDAAPWPTVRIAHGLAESPLLAALMADLVTGADATPPIPPLDRLAPEGSLVPAQKRRGPDLGPPAQPAGPPEAARDRRRHDERQIDLPWPL